MAKSLFVFGLAFMLYAYTISFDYAQDDAIVIKENMFTQEGLSGLSGIFSYDTFFGFFKEAGKDQLVQGGRYRPASVASFAIEQSIFGGNPYASHAINAMLYGLMCLLLFKLLIRLFEGSFGDQKTVETFAFVTALLFAAHPIHTEVVANIKGRDEIFVGLFGLFSIYMLFDRVRAPWKLIVAYISVLIAFFSKENAIIYIVIIPLSMWFFTDDRWNKKTMWLSSIPVFFMAAIYLVVRSQILDPTASSASMELMNNPFLKFDGSKMIPYDFTEKWATVIYNLGKYLQLIAFPFPLTSDYYPYHIPAKSFSNPLVLLSILTHLGLGFATIYGTIKKEKWAFGLLFYFGFLFLVSNVPLNIGTNVSERFAFIPSIGLITTLVYIIFSLGFSRKKIFQYSLPIILILFSFYTVYRSGVWKNDFTLLTTDVKYSSNSAKALHGAAGALSSESTKEKDETKRKEMILLSNEYLAKTLAVYPLYKNAYLIQGNNFYYMKEFEKARQSYESLLKLSPEHRNALQNLHVTTRDAGRYYGEVKNDLGKSIDYLIQAYNMNSKDYETVRLLGVCYGVGGQNEKAFRYFQEASDLSPQDPTAWLNLGNASYRIGDEESGKLYHEKAIELDPSLKNKITN
ncbi:hypothetical protein N9B82_05280 [Saprospiraceae bacterium]|nr:hypothetical protein [Saprospiraceae bacterium]